jgi:hypothetical protein
MVQQLSMRPLSKARMLIMPHAARPHRGARALEMGQRGVCLLPINAVCRQAVPRLLQFVTWRCTSS